MAMGKRRERQQQLWIAASELPSTQRHVFYDRVNEILDAPTELLLRRAVIQTLAGVAL